MLNFVGAGNTFAINGATVDISIAGGGGGSANIGIGTTVGDAFSAGIVTAGNLWYNTGEGRLFIYYQDEDSAQWVDAAPFNVGIITTLSDVAFSAGSAAAPSISFGTDSDSGFFSAGTDQPGVSAAGSQVARFNPGGVNVSGVVTATSFSGDGSSLTSLPAGLGTALNSDKSTFLGNVYYQDQVFSIGSTVTIDVPSTAIVGYTPYAEIQVTGSADLIVADGDEFIADVLGIGTEAVNSLGGSGGRIRADNYINSAGTGAPTFPSGVNVTGVATATQFKADSAIFSGNVSVGGTLTYQDVTNMDVLGIGTFQQGIQILANGANIAGIVTVGVTTIKSGEIEVVGVITATSFEGDFTGGVITATSINATGISTFSGSTFFTGGLAEKYENAGTTLGIQTANPLSDGNVILFTGNESSGTLTINFTGVHSTLSNGETVSFTAIITPNGTGIITIAQVDGQAITIKWSGGSAPSAGASGQDIYQFQILKTGTGVSDYTVFGAATNYA
jgi:hypothetical protein